MLVDVPADALGKERMEALQVYVRDVGRGLVMIGGQDSYGAGGYARTPLEETLPVEMDVRDRTMQPDIALVVVIDESGSMDACHCNTANRDRGAAIAGVPKVDIGKEAILRAVAALTDRDEFGVVAFNENAHWVIDTAPLGTVGDVEGQIAGIKAGGQTNIVAGLSAAVDSLETSSAERRHIVLLTDGWSSSGEYTALLERMKAANITLSAVGAGGGGANAFLEGLAEQGGGRYWPATNPASIPDIFLKETQQASGQQIIEEPFFPVQTGDSPILRGTEAGMPQLLGYNGSTLKPAAQGVLATGRDDPLLAQWQYGLGRSVAWTSDTTGRWAADWLGWSGFNRFFSQLVAWTFPGEESGGMEAELVADGDATRLRLRSTDADGTPRDFYDTTVRITSPGMEPYAVRLDQVAPGTYEAPLGILDPGAYAMRIDQTQSGKSPLGRTVVLVAPTPAEYRLLGTNDRLLAALRGATGGAGAQRRDRGGRRLGARRDRHHRGARPVAVAAAAGAHPVADRRGRATDVAWAAATWRWRGPGPPAGGRAGAPRRSGPRPWTRCSRRAVGPAGGARVARCWVEPRRTAAAASRDRRPPPGRGRGDRAAAMPAAPPPAAPRRATPATPPAPHPSLPPPPAPACPSAAGSSCRPPRASPDDAVDGIARLRDAKRRARR